MKKLLAVLISLSLAVSACSYLNNKEVGAITGAGIGGAIGGLAGGKKHRVAGVLIGAAAGAIAGLAIGHYLDKKVRTAEETAKVYQYEPRQGTMIEVEDVRIVPQLVQPGKPAKLIIDYAVLEKNPEKSIEVTEKRVIKSGDTSLKEIGPTVKTRKSGTYSTEQDVVFPASLSEGSYQLKGEIIANGRTSAKEATFEVAETMKGLDGSDLEGGSALQGVRGFAH